MLWEELLVGDFQEALERSGGLCVIPLGATEKHGPHLPLGTDSFIARKISKDAAEKEDAVVFSSFDFGQLLGFQHLPGSICLSTQTIVDYLFELCSEIARNGFRKILLLSAHGGNQQIMDVITQKTLESKKDYVVLSGTCYHRHPSELLKAIDERGRQEFPELTDEDVEVVRSYCAQPMDSGHACFCESLALMGARPELAKMSIANTESGEKTHRFDHLLAFKTVYSSHSLYSPFFWPGDYPNHYAGTYHPGANERIARAMHKLNVEFISKMFKAIKDDEELLKMNAQWNAKW